MNTYLKNLIRRTVRFAAREAADELARQGYLAKVSAPVRSVIPDPVKTDARSIEMLAELSLLQPSNDAAPVKVEIVRPVKIDLQALLQELTTTPANWELQRFFSMNHRWVSLLTEKNRRAAAESMDFVDMVMPSAMFILNQMTVIKDRRDEIMTLGGQILDLGVYKGGSTRQLAHIFPDETIHGFDSFEGLPEDWSHTPKGTFGDIKGVLPDMPDNVKLYKGWFNDTLPKWIEVNPDRPISLLRVDCDIYSSTKTIFDALKPLIRPGTWIVFDELIGYRGFRDHELKAFNEFLDESGYGYEFVAFGLTHAICYLKAPDSSTLPAFHGSD